VNRVFVEGVGLLGPGLASWEQAREVLSGRVAYQHAPLNMAASPLLPAAERRRASGPVNLALLVGREAFAAAGRDASATAAVFASSSGDGEILHRICEVLATPAREVSPTSFLNSVHNAPAGYWSIATKCHEPLTSLCGYDGSFAAGLLESATQAQMEQRPIALVAYDIPYPSPLHAVRPLSDKFAVALVIAPERSERALAALEVRIVRSTAGETRMHDARLETLRAGNPAARSLPLLAALAAREAGELALPYLENSHLSIRVAP
jgi:hypothetical protein